MSERNAYILGTDHDELFRLGIQHQVWSTETNKGWSLAGFTAGQTLLDLGCGPGFCTKELALITGTSGKVIGVDKSETYIHFLSKITQQFGLNINAVLTDFDSMELQPNSIDGGYCRWAMAWISNPKDVIAKVYEAMKPGGRFVFHEYFHWMTHQTIPSFNSLTKAIQECYNSFQSFEGDINVGRDLPKICTDLGFKIFSTRPLAKTARPHELTWQWPKTFYQTYFPKLVELNKLTKSEADSALLELSKLEEQPEALLCCPMMIEIIVEK